MEGQPIEPRTVMWAVAEVSWDDGSGAPNRTSATLEDTSPSGACVRVKRPFAIGSKVVIRWHREQFSAIARNCRKDGQEFLLGVRRDPEGSSAALRTVVLKSAPNIAAAPATVKTTATVPKPEPSLPVQRRIPSDGARPEPSERTIEQYRALHRAAGSSARAEPRAEQRTPQSTGSSPPHERKAMPTKKLFPNFWRRQQDEDAPDKTAPSEVPMNKTTASAPAPVKTVRGDLLSYEDIYHAAGIMNPRSGYSIHKVVEMLNSERLRALSEDIKRASVLMALDAAGTPVDDLLKDATRRQQALDAYEAGQRQQLEEFEASKNKENAQIEAEMERVRAHYAERIQNNRDQVAREKEALRNWQMAMQHESQRISEVVSLCRKQPVAPSANEPQPAASPARAAAAAVGAEKGAGEPTR